MGSGVTLVFWSLSTSVFVSVYMYFSRDKIFKDKTRKKICPGILNLGNTCFLNSLLQALAPCASITRCFETMVKSGHNLRNSLSYSLYSAFRVLNNEVPECSDHYNPKEILNTLYAKGWTIPSGEQDAYELFHVLMETLNEEKPGDSAIISLFDGTSLMQNSYLVGSEAISKFKTQLPKAYVNFLQLPFYGKMANQLICKKCSHRFPVKYDSFDSLSVALNSLHYAMGTSLETLLRQHLMTENIEGMQCDSCHTRSDFLKMMMLGKLPSTLCIHVQRTAWTAYGPIKRNDHVPFPDYLDMSEHMTSKCQKLSSAYSHATHLNRRTNGKVANDNDKNCELGHKKNTTKFTKLPYSTPISMLKALNFYYHVAVSGLQNASRKLSLHKTEMNEVYSELESLAKAYKKDAFCNKTTVNKMYRLVSVIVHLGDVSSGHFITYKRSRSRYGIRFPNKWIFASDTVVRPASSHEVFSSNAYMLLYEKL